MQKCTSSHKDIISSCSETSINSSRTKSIIEVQLRVLNTKDQKATIDIQEINQKIMHQNKHMISKNMDIIKVAKSKMRVKNRTLKKKDTGIKMKIQKLKIQEPHTSK